MTFISEPTHPEENPRLAFPAESVLEGSPEAFEAFDHQWRYIYLNRRAEEMRGCSREHLVGKIFWDEFLEVIGTVLHAQYLEAMQADHTVVFDGFQPHDGTWVEVSLHPYRDISVGGSGMLGVFTRDITERKRVEEALRRSQAEMEDFFENSTVGLHWVNESGVIVRANRAEMQMLGYTPEEYIGHSIAEFHVDVDVIEDILRRLSTGQELHNYEARLRCKDSSVRHVLISSSVLFENEKFVHTRCFTQDVTERRIAEAERARATEEVRIAAETHAAAEALRESEERFRLLVEGVKDYAIFLLDPEGRVTTWNSGAERAKGYTAEEIIGQHFSRFYTEEDIARRHPWAELEIAAREGSYEEEGWRVRKDGSRFFASVVITALWGKNGEGENGDLRGFAKVTRDITERRAREREQVVAEAAEQQRRLLRDVLSSVTEGRLILCTGSSDLPPRLPSTVLTDLEGAGIENNGKSNSASSPASHPSNPSINLSIIYLTKHSLRWARRRTVAAAQEVGLDNDRGNDLLTAVGEATMNAVAHAGGGTAYVGMDRASGTVQVWVEDTGKGIDMSRLPQAMLEHGYSTAGTLGHGFKLMLQSVDRVWLLTGRETGTTVVLEQHREAPKPSWLSRA